MRKENPTIIETLKMEDISWKWNMTDKELLWLGLMQTLNRNICMILISNLLVLFCYLQALIAFSYLPAPLYHLICGLTIPNGM